MQDKDFWLEIIKRLSEARQRHLGSLQSLNWAKAQEANARAELETFERLIADFKLAEKIREAA